MAASWSRRSFLKSSVSVAASLCALRDSAQQGVLAAPIDSRRPKYGSLVPDPAGILDLPRGFSYQVISRGGSQMDDGYLTPGKPDGMAAFPGPDGLTLLVMNHEMLPSIDPGPFGADDSLLRKQDRGKVYDAGPVAHRGGTSTLVFDTRRQRKVRQYLSLAGTARNCAGGPTPWGSWITCEETVVTVGEQVDFDNGIKFQCAVDHGFNFEVPARADIQLVDPVPLKDMGRFNHEAVAVDPRTGIVYQTEDRDDGLIYRFIPNSPGQLADGGKLQALCLADAKSLCTRNWGEQTCEVGQRWQVKWMDMDDVLSPEDDLRARGFEAGAARFARGEGMWYSRRQIFFACTNGGSNQTGQIWRYVPDTSSADGGTLELFIEPNDTNLLESADNLTTAPWGDLIVCEGDDHDAIRLVGVTMDGQLYTLASNHLRTEFAGVTFSPDGTTLFVNLQHSDLTVAITGPWHSRNV